MMITCIDSTVAARQREKKRVMKKEDENIKWFEKNEYIYQMKVNGHIPSVDVLVHMPINRNKALATIEWC